MGAGTSNSSGSNNFVSQPENLQENAFRATAPATGQGLYNFISGFSPAGTNGQAGGGLSPYQGQFGYFGENTNPLVAPLTGWQQAQLQNLNSYTNSNPLTQAQGTNATMLDPNYAASLAGSPQTAAAVRAAVAPQIQAFNAQTVPGLQGTFTAAGQRENAGSSGNLGGSSAFDIAGANAVTGLESQIGQTAGGIVNQAYQTGLAQTGQAVNQAQGLSTTNVSNLINTLNANALPQQTQQYGINQGLQLYQTQVNQLLQALGLGGQIAQPNIGVGSIGSGRSSSKGANFFA